MARCSRCRTIAALAAVAAGHGLLAAWLALFQPTLKFHARPDLDRQAVLVTLARLPAAALTPRPRRPVRPPRVEAPILPAAAPAPGPTTLAEALPEDLPNLARPVFRVWPRPLPPGVDWSGPKLGCADGRKRGYADADGNSPAPGPRCLAG